MPMSFKLTYLRKAYKSWPLLALAVWLAIAGPALAQEPLPQDLINEVGFDQKLDAQIPLELTFTDSDGQTVELSRYFGDKPVIISLGYYECPMLCSLTRNGLFESLKKLDFTVGDQFELLIVSIDPTETPDIAETNRRVSITEYGRSNSAEGWNFLVGQEDNIRQLAQAIGFRYTYDPNKEEYLHPSGIVVATPEGKLSHYFYGIEFPPDALRLALVEAAANKIGSPVDQFLLLCYHYDPVSGQYTLFLMNIIRMLGAATVVIIGGFLLIMFRRGNLPGGETA